MLRANLVQVAGIIDTAEAGMLLDAGVDYLGFPLRLPVHSPDLSEEQAARVVRDLPDARRAVLITYLDQADEIVEFCQRLGVQAVQLHADIALSELERLRTLLNDLIVIKSLVIGYHPIEVLTHIVQESSDFVDCYLTDTFDPRTGACGANGLTHDWASSRALVEFSPKPVILAGGLHAGNVAAAITAVRPFGVDVHTGVEGTDGRKCPDKVRSFVAAAKQAFSAL